MTLTVAELAAHKKLPAEWIKQEFGVHDGGQGVIIPYRNPDGATYRYRLRSALKAKDGSAWLGNNGQGQIAYGLHKLELAKAAKYLLIVEGETDTWTAHYHGYHALGLPGATAIKTVQIEHLTCIDRIFFVREPDQAGSQLAGALPVHLREIGYRGKILEVALQGAKDISDLHLALPADGFKKAFDAALKSAKVVAPFATPSDPAPIQLDMKAPPEMPRHIFTGWFGGMIEAVATATETPRELAAMMGLAAIAIATQWKLVVQVAPKYFESLAIWTLAALDSGNRKTAVLHAMVRPIVKYESDLAAKIAPERERLISEKKTIEARLHELRARAAKAKANLEVEGLKREIAELEKSFPDIPSGPRLWAQDITPEKLGSLMADNGEKMGILSDEGVFFAVLAGLYNGGTLNLDLALQAHSGAPVRVDRGSRPSVYMQRPALTLGLSPQPEVLRGLSDHQEFRGRGLLARFLFALPQSTLGYRTLNTAPVPDDVEKAYQAGLTRLLEIELSPNHDGLPVPYILHLTPEAHAEWKEFARTVEVDMRGGGRFEHARDWAGKLPGQAIRLAGLLHCAEDGLGRPWERSIGLDVMRRALELAAVLSYHALTVFELIGADPALEGAKRVAAWIERTRKPEFTARDCFDALKGHFKKMDAINEAFEILLERHLIFEPEMVTTGRGRPSRKFRVNTHIVKEWQ